MRVTDKMTQANSMEGLRRSRARMQDIQTKLSTMKEINRPSDNPAGTVTLMQTRKMDAQAGHFLQASDLAKSFLESTESTIGELNDILVRLKEIAIGQASSTASEDTRRIVSEDVKQALAQLKTIAHRRIGDRYLFSGFNTSQPPIDDRGNYLGDKGEMKVEIGPNSYVPINVTAMDVFGVTPKPLPGIDERPQEVPLRQPTDEGGPKSFGHPGDLGISNDEFGIQEKPRVNLLKTVDNLRISLLANDPEGIRNLLPDFDEALNQVIEIRAKLGSRIQSIDSVRSTMERDKISNLQLKSQIEDVNFDKAASDLSREESILRASMASASKVVQANLLDFLR